MLVESIPGAHRTQGLPIYPLIIPITVKQKAKMVKTHPNGNDDQSQYNSPKEDALLIRVLLSLFYLLSCNIVLRSADEHRYLFVVLAHGGRPQGCAPTILRS